MNNVRFLFLIFKIWLIYFRFLNNTPVIIHKDLLYGIGLPKFKNKSVSQEKHASTDWFERFFHVRPPLPTRLNHQEVFRILLKDTLPGLSVIDGQTSCSEDVIWHYLLTGQGSFTTRQLLHRVRTPLPFTPHILRGSPLRGRPPFAPKQ